jgi:hypothetical protein
MPAISDPAVKLESTVMRWFAKRRHSHDVFPVVVLCKGADLGYYGRLKPTGAIEEAGRIDREYLVMLMNDDEVLEVREGEHRCNKRCSDMRRNSEIYGMHLSYVGGYGSTPLEDLKRYSFSLCENCLADLFLTFKTLPSTENTLTSKRGL